MRFNKSECLLCGTGTATSKGFCPECLKDMPVPRQACKRCAVELREAETIYGYCVQCLIEPPVFDRCFSLYRYEFPVRELIANFKFQAGFAAGRAMADLLATKLQQTYGDNDMPGMLIPVPLHSRRLRERGYNQSMTLARTISRRCHIPLAKNYCQRKRATESQRGLSAEERATNLHNAFTIPARHQALSIKHVAIVDDVVTTMATVNAIARLLRDTGSRRIDVICLARVS
jgi:ComF family protein